MVGPPSGTSRNTVMTSHQPHAPSNPFPSPPEASPILVRLLGIAGRPLERFLRIEPVGVLLATWLSLRVGLSRLPSGITWRHLVVLGTVAGVGFTMALFIAQLAFTDSALLSSAKIGVLAASAGAGILALLLGWVLLPTSSIGYRAATADEAEASTEH